MDQKLYYVQRVAGSPDLAKCLCVLKPVDGADIVPPVQLLERERAAAALGRFYPALCVGQNAGAHQLADCILADFLEDRWTGGPGETPIVEEFRRDFLNLKSDQDAVEIDGLLIARWLSDRGLWEPAEVVKVATAPDGGPDSVPGSQPNIEG